MSRRTRYSAESEGRLRKALHVTVPAPAPVTPSVQWDNVLSLVVRTAEWDAKHAKTNCEEWGQRFAMHPSNALEWSRPIFEAAARYTVAQEVLALVQLGREQGDEYAARTSQQVVEEVRRIVYEKVIRGARSPARSTSVPSNEMEACLTARWADVLTTLEQQMNRVGREG